MMSTIERRQTIERLVDHHGCDDLTLAVVNRWLRSSDYPSIQNVNCEFVRGHVILSGVVPSYYLKQIAQTIVLKIEQVQGVDNRIEVRYE